MTSMLFSFLHAFILVCKCGDIAHVVNVSISIDFLSGYNVYTHFFGVRGTLMDSLKANVTRLLRRHQ